MKQLTHFFEYLGFRLFYGLFKLMPLSLASSCGGALACLIGPRLRAHKTAHRNLAIAFPDKDDAWRIGTIHAMWRNLGRVVGEFPHMRSAAIKERVTIANPEHLDALMEHYDALNFCGAHLGNWELFSLLADKTEKPTTLIYRHANNPYVDAFIRKQRTTDYVRFVAKGPEAAREILRAIKRKEYIGMLMDQKMNQGRMIPLFGKEAATPTTHAEMARRFKVPIVPVQCIRDHSTHFTMRFEEPILPPDGDDHEAIENAMLHAWHAQLEDWIRQHPEQWFWVHRRWPKEEYR